MSLFFVVYSNVSKAQTNTQEEPNIIFILTDDQRWNALGYAGNKEIKTPEMDKLAQQGAYFSTAIATTPICSASRTSIFTGVHERTHRYSFQTGEVKEEFMNTAYPRLLKQAGYHTGFFGKFGVNFSGKEEMFDEIEDYDRNHRYHDYRGYYYKTLGADTVHLTRYTGQKALDFIDEAPRDKPFCLSLSFSAPHAHDNAELQYFWQEESNKLYQDKDLPKPQLSRDKYFDRLPKAVQDGFNRLRWGWRYDTPEKYQHSVKGYYRMIYGVDLEIAKIRKKLKDTGLDENTIIILLGDNGQFLGERQIAGKWLMYDNSIRVPFIIYDPRTNHHIDVDEMALNIDVPSTILDYAGVNIPSVYQGKSLKDVVSGESESTKHDTVLIEHLWEFENIPSSEGVRTKDWKYFRYIHDKSIEELYYLAKDPQETKNLADKPKYNDILTELRRKVDEQTKLYADPYAQAPKDLAVEFIQNPQQVRIIDKTPDFSWSIPASGQYQKGFQLLVASSKENIDNNIGDMWNTGYSRLSTSTNIEYAGSPLNENSSYFWKVRYFDKDNRVSEYSEYQQFLTGNFSSEVASHNNFQVEIKKPIVFDRKSDNSYFIDFGKDAFATLKIRYKTEQEDTILVRIGEKLLNGKIDRNPGGTIRYYEVKLAAKPGIFDYELPLQADERNTNSLAVALPDSFPVLAPFRYAEIECAQKLEATDVLQEAYFYSFNEDNSYFNSSNDILNQVWEICKYTQKATSFAGYYVDGDRERIPYEADAYLNQLSHYSVDREYTLARKTIEYFFNSSPTWPTEWQLHVAMMMYQDYMYTGNKELIATYYERLKVKTLMDLEVEDGFISTKSPNHNAELIKKLGFRDSTQVLKDIVDWPPKTKNFGGKGPTPGERDGYVLMPINTVVNGFYYHNMMIMEMFANILDKPQEADDFALRAARVKKSINEKLFDQEKGYYIDGIGTEHASLHANMILLAFDIVPESRKKQVVSFVKSRGMACSVYGAQYLLEALYKAGEEQYALELMTATNDRSWYNMINIGSTITLEAWDLKYKSNTDWNHAWGAAPANIIPRYLWGITPENPGYEGVVISPKMGNLKSSSIKLPTIKGAIECTFSKKGARISEYNIELPGNLVGKFAINFKPEDEVRLNGVAINTLHKTIRLNPGVNKITIKQNSF